MVIYSDTGRQFSIIKTSYRIAWAMKLLTTRPSSMFILGPYVLKILAILISVTRNIKYESDNFYFTKTYQMCSSIRNKWDIIFTYSMLPMIVKHQCLSYPLSFIITTPNPFNTNHTTSMSSFHDLLNPIKKRGNAVNLPIGLTFPQ